MAHFSVSAWEISAERSGIPMRMKEQLEGLNLHARLHWCYDSHKSGATALGLRMFIGSLTRVTEARGKLTHVAHSIHEFKAKN